MARIHSTSSEPLLVAIDIAKYRHEVLIAEPGRKRRRRISLRNTRENYKRITEILVGYGRQVNRPWFPGGSKS